MRMICTNKTVTRGQDLQKLVQTRVIQGCAWDWVGVVSNCTMGLFFFWGGGGIFPAKRIIANDPIVQFDYRMKTQTHANLKMTNEVLRAICICHNMLFQTTFNMN